MKKTVKKQGCAKKPEDIADPLLVEMLDDINVLVDKFEQGKKKEEMAPELLRVADSAAKLVAKYGFEEGENQLVVPDGLLDRLSQKTRTVFVLGGFEVLVKEIGKMQ